MPVEIIIIFMIVAVGLAAYYYVESRTLKEINSDLRDEVDIYKTEIKSLDTEVLYWKTKLQEELSNKKNQKELSKKKPTKNKTK